MKVHDYRTCTVRELTLSGPLLLLFHQKTIALPLGWKEEGVIGMRILCLGKIRFSFVQTGAHSIRAKDLLS